MINKLFSWRTELNLCPQEKTIKELKTELEKLKRIDAIKTEALNFYADADQYTWEEKINGEFFVLAAESVDHPAINALDLSEKILREGK